ncbi:MAG TPA: hypothetical protein VD999_02185 [Vitreimonas sp.]|nr:hypothetical protein [Vitreimonas sp.]
MATKTSAPKLSLWNQLYFVLATLIGLICLVIGISSLVNTWLLSSFFKVEEPRYSMPPQPYFDTTQFEKGRDVTAEQKESLALWQAEYKRWEEEQKNFDYQAQQRKRDYAWAIALILTGGPVFALHAPVVFRRVKREE